METTNKKKSSGFKGIKSAWIVIVCCFIVAVCIYQFVLGNPANFMNNDPNNHPLPGNFLGTIYKGLWLSSLPTSRWLWPTTTW